MTTTSSDLPSDLSSDRPAGGDAAAERGALLALDVGDARIGMALAPAGVALARPFGWVQHDESVFDHLRKVISDESVTRLVVGLPRNLNGDDTAQTAVARRFAQDAGQRLGVAVVLQDEALTSHRAEAELRQRAAAAEKGDVDALAAVYILEDYLQGVYGPAPVPADDVMSVKKRSRRAHA